VDIRQSNNEKLNTRISYSVWTPILEGRNTTKEIKKEYSNVFIF